MKYVRAVNSIPPGYMATEMAVSFSQGQIKAIVRRSPLRELATAGDVAAVVIYLLPPDVERVTGIDLPSMRAARSET